jgi:hypothetical protein
MRRVIFENVDRLVFEELVYYITTNKSNPIDHGVKVYYDGGSIYGKMTIHMGSDRKINIKVLKKATKLTCEYC